MDVKLDRSVYTADDSPMQWVDHALTQSPTGEVHTLDVYVGEFIVGVYDWTEQGATQEAMRKIRVSIERYTAALNALKGE